MPYTRSALTARQFTTRLGWSTPAVTASAMGNPRASDYCPPCTRKRARRAAICPRCDGGELFDLLGHTRVGHLAARALYQYDASLTGEDLLRLSRADLLAMPAVGDQIADCVVAAIAEVYGFSREWCDSSNGGEPECAWTCYYPGANQNQGPVSREERRMRRNESMPLSGSR